jgi:hypothetical protein
MPRILRRAAFAAGAALALSWVGCITPGAKPGAALLARPAFRLTSAGGGSGGTSGSAIWASTWWNGSPEGPGPYVGSPPSGVAICVWHDLGSGLAALDADLSQSSLPLWFWSRPEEGGRTGIWAVNYWAVGLMRHAPAGDHIDLVACPDLSQVPSNGADVLDLPRAFPPKEPPVYVWLFWDTVPNPPPGKLPGIIGKAYDEVGLPVPQIGTAPSEVDGVHDATVVNLPTWLWVEPRIWHLVSATASGGGYVATVWAVPATVRWTAYWDFPADWDDPEGGTTFGPEVLSKTCDGPGSVYDDAQPGASTNCSFSFTQSSFGTSQLLQASVTWQVWWALSSAAGVVGGEGSLGTVDTTGTRPIRVMQVESIISSG